MKRFGLFLLVTMAAAIFTSCNDSDGDYPRLSAFASVKPLENNDFYVVLDDGKTVYPGDKSRIGSYKAEEDQRVVIYFNLLNNKVEGYDYNMALYYIQDIYSGGTKVVTTQEELDALEDDKTSFKEAFLNSNYLNVWVGFNACDLTKHTFLLVRNNVTEIAPEYTEEGYLNLEPRRPRRRRRIQLRPLCLVQAGFLQGGSRRQERYHPACEHPHERGEIHKDRAAA